MSGRTQHQCMISTRPGRTFGGSIPTDSTPKMKWSAMREREIFSLHPGSLMHSRHMVQSRGRATFFINQRGTRRKAAETTALDVDTGVFFLAGGHRGNRNQNVQPAACCEGLTAGTTRSTEDSARKLHKKTVPLFEQLLRRAVPFLSCNAQTLLAD